jgi:hypothetical protein
VSDDRLHNTEPRRLAEALSIAPGTGSQLSARELAEIVQHQLQAPLGADFPELADTSFASTTWGQLLSSTDPPLPVLERIKGFAKASKSAPDGPLPVEVATVLYFASIVKASLACQQRISALSPAQLDAGIRWVLEQPWVPEPICALLEQASQSR